MEIRQLKYFISAATHLNFTKAAKECFIVQTAITAQIANLEEELGVKLFERRSRGLALTEAGELFFQEAKEIVARIGLAREKMSALRGGYRSLLRIGHHGELFRAELTKILREFRRQAPGVKVMLYQLTRGDLVSGVRDGQLDLALLASQDSLDEKSKFLDWDLLGEDEPMLAVSLDHPLADRREVTLEEANRYPRIRFHSKQILCGEEGEEGDSGALIYGQTQDHASCEILTESGYCASVWPARMCRQESHPELRFLRITGTEYRSLPALIWRRGELSAEGELFRRLVGETCKREA